MIVIAVSIFNANSCENFKNPQEFCVFWIILDKYYKNIRTRQH